MHQRRTLGVAGHGMVGHRFGQAAVGLRSDQR